MKKIPITILSIFAVTILLLFFAYYSLSWYTNHDKFVVVPNIKGKSMFDAKKELNNFDLDFLVVDSTYDESKPPLSVIDQQPRKGAKVKEKRKIYITLNAASPPRVKIPSIIDNSRRQAELILESWGLKLGQLIYVPDMARDAVQNIQVNGKIVKPGLMVAKGTIVDLILGDGFGSQTTDVPPLNDGSLTVLEAIAVIQAVHLNVGMLIADGTITDTMSAYVYDQEPKSGQPGKLGPGNTVQLFIRQNKAEIPEETDGLEKLKKPVTQNP